MLYKTGLWPYCFPYAYFPDFPSGPCTEFGRIFGPFWLPYAQEFGGVEEVTSSIFDWEIDWSDSTISFQ